MWGSPDRRLQVFAATALAVGVAGCSLGSDSEPKPEKKASGAPNAIAAVVGRLQAAAARGDYATVCDELFTAGARRRAGGAACPGQLRRRAGPVAGPRIDLLSLDLHGDAATVKVRTMARGEPPATDTLRLVRQRGRYLVDSLGG